MEYKIFVLVFMLLLSVVMFIIIVCNGNFLVILCFKGFERNCGGLLLIFKMVMV